MVHCAIVNFNFDCQKLNHQLFEAFWIEKVSIDICRNTKLTGNEKMAAFSEIKKSNSKETFTLIKTIGDILPAGQGC